MLKHREHASVASSVGGYPEIGQAVLVRGHRWVVERVAPDALGSAEVLLELAGVDDDSLGERSL